MRNEGYIFVPDGGVRTDEQIACARADGCASSRASRSCSRWPAARASRKPPLRIGTNVWIGSEPLYLARELGHLDPAAVQLVEYPSASEVLRAYRNQAIDGMVISLDELFGLAADGLAAADHPGGGRVARRRRGRRPSPACGRCRTSRASRSRWKAARSARSC